MKHLSRNLCAVLLAAPLLLAMPSPAGATGRDAADQDNTVNLTIQGGDAAARATCLNDAKQGGRQDNQCQNTAVATGGTVILKNVDITVVQTNKA